MFGRLFALFVLVPLVELALLIEIGGRIGALPTVAIVLLTGIAGAALARAQGLRAMRSLQAELASGRAPGGAILDGVAILAGGLLLLTPGILTDMVGFLLLVPWSRERLKSFARRRLEGAIAAGTVRVSGVGVDFGSGPRPARGGGAPPGGRSPDASEGEVGEVRIVDADRHPED